MYFLFSAIGNENLLLNVKIGLDFLRETETMKQVQFSFQGSEDLTPGYKRCENQCKHKYAILNLDLLSYVIYRTRAIITCGLYICYPVTPLLCFQGGFFRKLCLYVWLVSKSLENLKV